MIYFINIFLAFVFLSTVTAGNVVGSQVLSAFAVLETPLHAGPHPPLPTGNHPSFPWPPTSPFPHPSCKKVQYDFPGGTNSNTSRADAVRGLYERSWAQYDAKCFGESTMLVVSDACLNDLNGWGATIVDGIDTAIVMGLKDIVTKQLAFIAKADFTYVLCLNVPELHVFNYLS
jgi:hypothetical protein